MSLKKSCSCRFLVPVETTTRLPERIAGTRYASVFPVPVPASTMRWRLLLERLFDGLGHLQLAAAKLVSRMGTSQQAPWSEELV